MEKIEKFKGSAEAYHMCDSLREKSNSIIDELKEIKEELKALKEGKKNEPSKK